MTKRWDAEEEEKRMKLYINESIQSLEKDARRLNKYLNGKGLIMSPNISGILIVGLTISYSSMMVLLKIFSRFMPVIFAMVIAFSIAVILIWLFTTYCYWRRDVVIWEKDITFKDSLLKDFPIRFGRTRKRKEG